MGFSRQEYWSGLPFLPPDPGIEHLLYLLHWQVHSLLLPQDSPGGGPGRGDCSVLQMRKLRAWLPSPLLFLLLKCCPRKVTPGSGQVLRWRAWLVGHLGLPVSTVESAQRPGEGHPGAACGEGAAAGVHPDRPPSAPQLRGPPHALHHFWGWRYGLPHHPLHGA